MNIIKTLDENFNEIYLNFQILGYLSRKFDSIMQNILRWPDKEFQFDKIVNELVAEETCLQVRDQDSIKISPSVNTLNIKKKSPRLNKLYKCWFFGKDGHLKNKYHEFLKSRFSSSKSCGPAFVTSCTSSPSSREIVNSRASFHDDFSDRTSYNSDNQHSQGSRPGRRPSSPYRHDQMSRRNRP